MSTQTRLMAVFAACLILPAVGCVKRTLTITTDPPGATVVVDGETVGVTPLEMPFTFYGTREILLEKEGYSTFKAKHTEHSPVWELFPFDFVPEVMIPFTIHDAREVQFTMTPLSEPLPEALLQRAEEMRRAANPVAPEGDLDTPGHPR